MTERDQPAYPEIHVIHWPGQDSEGTRDSVLPRWRGGLTKREYFAAMALAGLPAWNGGLHDSKLTKESLAQAAVAAADALIEALNK